MTNAQSPALEVSALSAGYGRFDVVRDISLQVGKGEAVALLGPNGAGKTTVLKAIMGLVKKRRGAIRVRDVNVSALPPYRIARGLAAIAPEGRRLFLEEIGGGQSDPRRSAPPSGRPRVERLARPRCSTSCSPSCSIIGAGLSSFLTGGEQQMVAIGRMLMSDPGGDAPRRTVDRAVTWSRRISS